MIEDHFGLEDDAYWTDPWAARKTIQRSLMQCGHEDFLIGAPKRAAWDRHKSLPLAILRVRKAQGGSPVDFRASAVVAAWDMNLGKLHARLAFPKATPALTASKRPAAPAAKGDSFSGDATAMVSEAATLDLAARLKLPEEGNEYVVSLVCMDKASNRCRIRVVESAAFRDEAAEAFVRALREEQSGPPLAFPEAGVGLTAYTRQPTSPDIPDEPGINLVAQRVTMMRADRPCVVQGSFRLPARPLTPLSGPALVRDPKSPTAMMSIGLLLTGSVTASPVVLDIKVPCYGPLERMGGESYATGYFALDLCAHVQLAGLAQTYFIYAFSGEAMAGPALAAFVNPILTWQTREEAATAHRQAASAPA